MNHANQDMIEFPRRSRRNLVNNLKASLDPDDLRDAAIALWRADNGLHYEVEMHTEQLTMLADVLAPSMLVLIHKLVRMMGIKCGVDLSWRSKGFGDICAQIGIEQDTLKQSLAIVLGYTASYSIEFNKFGPNIMWVDGSPATICKTVAAISVTLSEILVLIEAAITTSVMKSFADVSCESEKCCICLRAQASWHDTRSSPGPGSVRLTCGHVIHRGCTMQVIASCISAGGDFRCPLCRAVYMRGCGQDEYVE
jgi:hypothetical protein